MCTVWRLPQREGLADPPLLTNAHTETAESWRLAEAPPSLAVRGALTESESRQGCDPEHEDFVPPDGVTETKPGTRRRREIRAVLRLECVGDASEFGWVAHLRRLTFDDDVQPVESVATGREDATRVAREVLGFAFVWTGAEVQRAVQPDSQQRGDVRTPVRLPR